MNKAIYKAAFNIQKTQNTLANNLLELGLSFEYGDGIFGKAMSEFVQESDTIIKEALGLYYKEIDIMCNIMGTDYPSTICVLYTAENDPKWSITEDDFCQFLYEAIIDERLQDLMWSAMVDKDDAAKSALNATKKMTIGTDTLQIIKR